jgi:hypothetical protein
MTAALFVLLPAGDDGTALFAAAGASTAGLRVRRYSSADDAAHLRSLLRDGRDPLATTWRRGALRAVAAGAVIGGLVHGALAGFGGMFGGLLGLAIPLGLGIGAFLGGFTAAMTGTHVPRDELAPLWPAMTRGARLLQCAATASEGLAELRRATAEIGLPAVFVTG